MVAQKKWVTVREVPQVIGKIVASFHAVKYGPLHYRSLESDKMEALKKFCGYVDHRMTLSSDSKHELQWWMDNVQIAYNDVCE